MTTSSGGDRGRDAGPGLTALMSDTVADVRLPDGLLDRAVARNRRRATRNRLIGAVSTAAAAAVAVALLVSLPGARPATPAPPGQAINPQPTAPLKVETAAYVLAHASAAQLNSRKLISVTNSVGTMYTDVSLQQQRYVAALRAKDGQPYFEWADTIQHGIWTETMVVNQYRVYSVLTMNSDGVQVAPFLPLQQQSDPMAAFYTALKKHQIAVVGHRTLNGRDTILLRIIRDDQCGKKPELPGYLKSGAAAKCVNGRVVYHPAVPDDEVWIDAHSYLVVQTKVYKVYFQQLKSGHDKPFWRSWITTVSWLAPTKENLAKLSATPPPGYAKVPYSDMVKYLGPIS
jgi:hypothetical protein